MKQNIVILKKNDDELKWISDEIRECFNISYFSTVNSLKNFLKIQNVKKIISYLNEINIGKDIDILYLKESTESKKIIDFLKVDLN